MWSKWLKWKFTFEMIRSMEQVLLQWQWPHNNKPEVACKLGVCVACSHSSRVTRRQQTWEPMVNFILLLLCDPNFHYLQASLPHSVSSEDLHQSPGCFGQMTWRICLALVSLQSRWCTVISDLNIWNRENIGFHERAVCFAHCGSHTHMHAAVAVALSTLPRCHLSSGGCLTQSQEATHAQ